MKTHPIPGPLPAPSPCQNKRHWWFYALIAGGALLLLGTAGVVALFFHARSLIATYTSPDPDPITKTEVTEADRQALSDKWIRFYQELTSERPAAPLSMSPRELNVFVAMMPRLKDRVHVTIAENRLRVEFAMPLDAWGDPPFLSLPKGRYANGVAELNLRLGEDGAPRFDLVSLNLNGKPFPGWVKSQLHRDRNLQDVLRVMSNDKLLSHLASIEIRDGLLVFTPMN